LSSADNYEYFTLGRQLIMGRLLRIAMLSIHSSPLGRLGSADTGGMSIYLLELASEIGKRGHLVDIFTRHTAQGWMQVLEYAPNVRIISLTVEGTENLVRSALLGHLHRFCAAIDNFKRREGSSYDLIHSNYWLSGVVGEQLKVLWCCPHVITFHTLAAVKMAALKGHTEDRNRISEETRLLRCCDGVIVPTAEEGQYLASILTGESAPLHHIPWGVNMDHFTTGDPAVAKIKIAGLDSKPLLLFVGRFDPMKGIDLALRSVCHLVNTTEIHLALIGGDGPESPSSRSIEQLANDLGFSDRVHMLGPVEHSQMVLYYQKADAVVVSSRYESFGLVILEALASGTPVASTAVGIASYIILPGINGYLAAPGDDRSLAEAISNALALADLQDAEIIRQSVSDFTWSKVATIMLDAYNGTLANT